MDIQTKKLNIIEYLINIQDEELINKIESTILINNNSDLMPFSKDQLIKRAKKSNEDYLNKKFTTHKNLQKESQNW